MQTPKCRLDKGNYQPNKMNALRSALILFVVVFFLSASFAQKPKIVEPPKPLFKNTAGGLAYTPDPLGNRVPDFSHAGYMGGDSAIPMANIKIVVPLKDGDATLRIQSALNYVSKLPVGKDGLRGAVLLERGTYQVSGVLKINASGVVLRGSGMGNDGTLILASGLDRIGVIRMLGLANRTKESEIAISDNYVPVNATRFNITNAASFKIGDHIMIKRPSPKNWIDDIGANHFGGGITSL
ncbi:MAG: DUF6298 domain-containing protein, partial [Bacteroidia bacterium]